MLEAHTPEIRRELAAVRVAALRRSARPTRAGPLRRSLGNAFVRFGLLLGSDGSVPPSTVQPASLEEVSAPAGASSILLSSRRAYSAVPAIATWDDFARELAAPYGIRVAEPLTRTRARSGSRPGAPSARSRDSRRPSRFDAR
jgi:hypothetical protein